MQINLHIIKVNDILIISDKINLLGVKIALIKFNNDGSVILKTKDDIEGFLYVISQEGYQENDHLVQYPIIIQECNDKSGHYYVATSPNLQGLVTDGNTEKEVLINSQDAIATLLDIAESVPKVQNPNKWHLKPNQQVRWVTTNLSLWQRKYH